MPLFSRNKSFLPPIKSTSTTSSDSVTNEEVKEITEMPSTSAPEMPEQPREVIPRLVKHVDCVTYLKDKLACQNVHVLECGNYGIDVYSVVPSRIILDQEDTKPVVVKVFRFGVEWSLDEEGNRRERLYQNEINCFKRIKHAHIVDFFRSFEFYGNNQTNEYSLETSVLKSDTSSHLLMSGIVLEQLECTLLDYLGKKYMTCLNDMLTEAVFYQIGNALVYLHGTHFIVHRDLKWNNIGVSGTDAQGIPHLKLFDFGNAQVLKKEIFQAAEVHSSCFDLSLAKCEITQHISEQNESILIDQNAFLQESQDFARMMINIGKYDSDGKFIEKAIRFNVEDEKYEYEIVEMFDDLEISDSKLKSLLIRMATTKRDYEKISITSAMNYFNSK